MLRRASNGLTDDGCFTECCSACATRYFPIAIPRMTLGKGGGKLDREHDASVGVYWLGK